MPETISISLTGPLSSIELLDTFTNNISLNENTQTDGLETSINDELRAEKERVSQFCLTIENITKKLTNLYETSISEHKQQIAQLCVEIAGKILIQKIDEGDYKIENIVQEVLNSSPGGKEIKIYLNPTDYQHCQKIQKEENIFTSINFVSDPEVGRAECIFESTKGNIESFIDSKLKQIAEELKKAI
ncbi:MAG TPA: FliH/SctL family protein [Sedimentisphaerales bacterium]|nr:FliH/SctL family protein [Sedimentisphaerales bacterium]